MRAAFGYREGARIHLLGCLMLLGLLVWTSGHDVYAQELADVLEWREFTHKGPYSHTGRVIDASITSISEIDIDSRVTLRFDGERLRSMLAADDPAVSSEIRGLQDRLDTLGNLIGQVERLPPLLVEVSAAAREVGANSTPPNRSRLQAVLADFNATTLVVKKGLLNAIETRLLAEGETAQAARDKRAVYNDQIAPPGKTYDWGRIAELLEEEMSLLEKGILAVKDTPAYQVLVEAHYYQKAKMLGEIHLPGYNEVALCEATPFRKMRFEMTAAEAELRTRYIKLATDLNATSDKADQFILVLEELYPDVRVVVNEVTLALESVKSQATDLSKWAEKDTVAAWFATLSGEIRASAEGREFEAKWRAVAAAADSLGVHLKVIRNLTENLVLKGGDRRAAIRSIIALVTEAGAPSADRLASAFSAKTWQRRADLIRELGQAADALSAKYADSEEIKKLLNAPLKDLMTLRDGVQTVLDKVGPEFAKAGQFFAGLIEGGSVAEEMSRMPQLSTSRAVCLGEDVDTEFNLMTFCQDRREDDMVSVRISFWDGEQLRGRKYTYDFRISVMGWQSNLYSSLARVQREQQSNWRYDVPVSFVVNYRKWTAENSVAAFVMDDLFHDILQISGFGFSTVPLDYEDGGALQLGIGPTVTMFDDFLLFGVGWNLDVDRDRRYGFISLRLFNLSDQVGLTAGKAK